MKTYNCIFFYFTQLKWKINEIVYISILGKEINSIISSYSYFIQALGIPKPTPKIILPFDKRSRVDTSFAIIHGLLLAKGVTVVPNLILFVFTATADKIIHGSKNICVLFEDKKTWSHKKNPSQPLFSLKIANQYNLEDHWLYHN